MINMEFLLISLELSFLQFKTLYLKAVKDTFKGEKIDPCKWLNVVLSLSFDNKEFIKRHGDQEHEIQETFNKIEPKLYLLYKYYLNTMDEKRKLDNIYISLESGKDNIIKAELKEKEEQLKDIESDLNLMFTRDYIIYIYIKLLAEAKGRHISKHIKTDVLL